MMNYKDSDEVLAAYQPWEFCKAIECSTIGHISCKSCGAYQLHDYLQQHNQINDEKHIAYMKQLEEQNDVLSTTVEQYVGPYYELKERLKQLEAVAEAARRMQHAKYAIYDSTHYNERVALQQQILDAEDDLHNALAALEGGE